MSRAAWPAWAALLAVACGGGPPETPEGPAPEPLPGVEEAPAPEAMPEAPVEPLPEGAVEPEPGEPGLLEPEVMEPEAAEPELLELEAVEPEAAPMPPMGPPAEPEAPRVDLGPGTIGPGMSEDDVRRILGEPLASSAYGEHTFYFYDNGCEKECGFLDFVIFRSGRVVDAVFRHSEHHYAGNSSSPPGVTPRPTPGGGGLTVPPPPADTVPTPPR